MEQAVSTAAVAGQPRPRSRSYQAGRGTLDRCPELARPQPAATVKTLA
jgi:hypothetical protein